MLKPEAADAPVLALGFSGGGDSTALLIALRVAWPDAALHALIVDHRLRPGSAREAELAARRARELGAQAHIMVWDAPRPGQGAARLARHRLLAQACRRVGAQILFLGHALDDRVETLRMRAERGGADPTLAVMAPVSWSPVWPEGRGLIIARPLTGVWRASLRAALRRMGAAWIDDPSNADRRFERVRVRQDPLPQNEAKALLDKGDHALQEAARIGAAAHGLIEQSCTYTPWGGINLDSASIASAGTLPARRAAGAVLAAVSGAPAPPPPRLIARFLSAAFNGRVCTGSGALITDSGAAGRDPGAAGRADGAVAAPPLELTPGACAVYDGRYEITPDAPVRLSLLGARRPGLGEGQAPGLLRPGLILIEGASGPVLAGEDGPGRWLLADRVRSLTLPPALPAWFDVTIAEARACAALAVAPARSNI
ncbi:MAG: tRNA lysidine(34) synthetase TilS [Oceanicaulis sp.]|nr:tRNA lysidine(34) synthetase TilS [Oceanicaulis sp.]